VMARITPLRLVPRTPHVSPSTSSTVIDVSVTFGPASSSASEGAAATTGARRYEYCPVGGRNHRPAEPWSDVRDDVMRCPTCAHAWTTDARRAVCGRVGRKSKKRCARRLTIETRYGKLGYVCDMCKDKRKFVRV